mmetsp:Transcript_16907/g.64396  ORF Transcript_16907/g.64396 Transcript_16907/m.64396 type:complete len:211 (-) Transcript_16907:260-892(-)
MRLLYASRKALSCASLSMLKKMSVSRLPGLSLPLASSSASFWCRSHRCTSSVPAFSLSALDQVVWCTWTARSLDRSRWLAKKSSTNCSLSRSRRSLFQYCRSTAVRSTFSGGDSSGKPPVSAVPRKYHSSGKVAEVKPATCTKKASAAWNSRLRVLAASSPITKLTSVKSGSKLNSCPNSAPTASSRIHSTCRARGGDAKRLLTKCAAKN